MTLKPGIFDPLKVFRNIVFFLLLVSPFQESHAQSLSIESFDSIVIGDAWQSNAICLGTCYLPEVSESTMAITIGAGAKDSLNFTGHVYPDKDGIPNSLSICKHSKIIHHETH